MIGEAGRENDQSCGDGDKGVQHDHPGGFAQKRVFFADITAEDRHGADTKTQCEKGLIHSAHQRTDHTDFLHPCKVWQQIEGKPFLGAGQEETVDRQDYHDGQQRQHHDLGDPFQAALQAPDADQNTDHDHHDHPERHHAGIGKHVCKDPFHRGGVQPLKSADGGQVKIVQHPAGDRGVEHHQKIAANQRDIAVNMPFLPGLFQGLVSPHGAFLAGAAHGEFHAQNRQAENNQEYDIKKHKRAAPALTGHVRKFPYVSDTDGAARGKQDKSKSGTQLISFHGLYLPLLQFLIVPQKAGN